MITGGGAEVRLGGSGTSLILSRDISMLVVDIWNSWSDLRGLESLLTGLSDLRQCSDLSETGDMDPSSLLRLAGDADNPDMSLVMLETRAEVSD